MSTNLDPPIAHVHEINFIKTENRSPGVPKHAEIGIPTDLSIASVASTEAALRFNQRNLEFGRDAFMTPLKSAGLGSTLQPGLDGSSKFHHQSLWQIPKHVPETKITNNAVIRKDIYLRDPRQTPSPVIMKTMANSPGEIGSPSRMLKSYKSSSDAMLSAAINVSENEMLREGGFELPSASNHIGSSDDTLASAGPSSNCSSLRPPSNTTFELFDEENSRENYCDSGQDLRLSPNTLSNSSNSTTDSNPVVVTRNVIPPSVDVISKVKLSGEETIPGIHQNGTVDLHIAKNQLAGVGAKIVKVKPKGYGGKSGSIPCPTCGKMFSSSSALTKHKLTHSDERKYVCQLCSKAFKRQDHLNGHMLTHRSKKPYECKIEGCGKSYCDARSLRRHNENHHSQQLCGGMLNNELLLSRIQYATSMGQLHPDQLSESAAAQLKMLALQGGVDAVGSGSRLQNALLGWQNKSGTADGQNKLDSNSQSTAVFIEHLKQRPKLWAELNASALRLDSDLIPKPVACSICHKSFKNMPALNGHMRLHGGYFKKDEVRKEEVEKKETSSATIGTPLQTASSSVRALIGEKIIQRKNASGQHSLPVKAAGSFNSSINQQAVSSMKFVDSFNVQPSYTAGDNLQYVASQTLVHNATPRGLTQPSTHSNAMVQNQPFTHPSSSTDAQQHSFLGNHCLLEDNAKCSSNKVSTNQNNYSSSPTMYALSHSSDELMHGNSSHSNEVCHEESVDCDQIEPSVQLKTETDDVFMSESELKQTLEELKKEFMMPQASVEKFRRHSDSDHFIVPKACSSMQKNSTLTDQLRRKALTQRRTYRLASDPGGDPFCDIAENPNLESNEMNPEADDLEASLFHQDATHQAQNQFSNPTTPTQQTVGFFSADAMDVQDSLSGNPPANGMQASSYVPMHTEQVSAPSTPTQQQASFFHIDGNEPRTPNQNQTFFDEANSQHENPLSNPCTPTQSNVGFFQHHNNGHASMPNTPTQRNASFFSSQPPSHVEHFSNPNTPTQQQSFFSSQDHVLAPQHASNQTYYHLQQQQNQFSVPTTLSHNHMPYYSAHSSQLAAPSTPTDHQTSSSVFAYPSESGNSTSSYMQPQSQLQNYDKTPFTFPKTCVEVNRDSNANVTGLVRDETNGVFSENYSSIEEKTTMDSLMEVQESTDNHLPSISITDGVLDNFDASLTENLKVTNVRSKSPSSNSLLLTIPKSAQCNDCNDNVFISPSSLPTSPMRMKRKNRPEPLFIPPHVNTCGFQSRLRSPRLWDRMSIDKKQLSPPPYTPPPMLSPVRSGPGLFWQVISSSGSATPKSAPITPRFPSVRKSSTESIPTEEEVTEAPETDIQPHVNIGSQYQAAIPRFRSFQEEILVPNDKATLVWDPTILNNVSEEEVEDYLEFSCTSCMPGNGRNKEYALHVLQLSSGNIQEAMTKLMLREPYLTSNHHFLEYHYPETNQWQPEEIELYHQALSKSEKDFFSIAKEVKTKSVKECVEFYYIWKKVSPDEYKRLRTIRRKREQENVYYGLRSKTAEDADPSTPKSDRSSSTPDKELDASAVGEKMQYSCEYPDCTATFISKQALNGHVRIHGGTRPISPANTMAGKEVNAHSSLDLVDGSSESNIGLPISDNEINDVFPCKICGKVFHKVKSRSAHMKKHRQTEAEKRAKSHQFFNNM